MNLIDDPDQLLRENIPGVEVIPTQYRPTKDMLMVIPLPGTEVSSGGIYIPEGSRVHMNEGHVVAKGPLCSQHIEVGDCITWDVNSEFKLAIDKARFLIVREVSVLLVIKKKDLIASAEARASQNQPQLPLS